MEKSDPKEAQKELAFWNSLFMAMERLIKEDLALLKTILPVQLERIKPLSSGGNLWVYLIILLQLIMILLHILSN